MNRHCRHCRPGCQGASPVRFGAPRKHYSINYAAWSDGECPACAEAQRIADAIADAAPRENPLHRNAIHEAAEDAFRECWDIARGGADGQ